MSAPFGVDGSREGECCLLQILASGEPREEGLITGKAALAQPFEFAEDRLPGSLLSEFGTGAHRT